MSSKGRILHKLTLRRWILAITILCTSVWCAPVETLAQEAAPAALNNTAHSTLWSFEGPGNNAPYLVIGMADRGETPYFSLLRIAEDQTTNPSTGNTITRRGGPADSNRNDKIEFGPLPLSSFLDPTVGVASHSNFLAESTTERQSVPRSLAPRSFVYGYQANCLPPKRRLRNNESFTHKGAQAPRPLFELEFGSWRLPVMLSGAAVSQ